MRRRRRGEEGAVLLSDITAITGLAKGNGDVIHLQAPLLSSELKLREREREREQKERKLRRFKCLLAASVR